MAWISSCTQIHRPRRFSNTWLSDCGYKNVSRISNTWCTQWAQRTKLMHESFETSNVVDCCENWDNEISTALFLLYWLLLGHINRRHNRIVIILLCRCNFPSKFGVDILLIDDIRGNTSCRTACDVIEDIIPSYFRICTCYILLFFYYIDWLSTTCMTN